MNSIKKVFPVILCISIALVLANTDIFAKEKVGKRPFAIKDYAQWRSIVSTSISENGNWISYAYQKVKADDEFHIISLVSDKKYVIPRGTSPKFSDDSKWAAYMLKLPWKEAEKLLKNKKPVPQKAEFLNLDTGEKITCDNAASFNFSKGAKFFAVKKKKPDSKAKHKGCDLILYNLISNMSQNLGSISEFKFNKPGTMLAYIVDAADKSGNGLYLIELNTGVLKSLDSGKADYVHINWNEKGTALSVLKGTKKKKFKEKDNVIIAFLGLGDNDVAKIEYDPAKDSDFPKDMVISEKIVSQSGRRRSRIARGNLFWSEDSLQLFCGIKEQEKEPEKPGEDEDPPADVDIWHWNDEYLQSVQKIRVKRDTNFTYRSVYNIKEKRFIRLTDKKMRTISITRDGKWGIGYDNKVYISDWKEAKADYYRVNTLTGKRTLMFKGQKQTLGLSPDSKHFLYWKDSHIWDYVIESGKAVNLTEKAPVSFINKEYDHPGTKPPHGITGWTKDRKSVIISHKYDLFLQPLNDTPAKNLTGGIGAEKEIRFRYIKTDPEEKFIDMEDPLLLSAFGRWTKKAGFFTLDKGVLKENVYTKNRFGTPVKAKKADVYFYTIEDFKQFPDYYISTPTFSEPRCVTKANPHLSEYKWGYNILIEYTNKNGERLQGVLSIPDDYKQGQKLPMLVDFYEKNSHNLYRFSRMVYRDTPMFYKYVSNGYLVLLPDVFFNTGATHSDMLDCVEAAVKKVIDLGYADPERIGLHGHSFSGQGAALIATRSKMFAAIVAGAAATDLISDFNQLWKSSGTNQHHYDYYGQGRFGTNPFDDLELYMQESALFNAPAMSTPLLILHGTADGSVEWLQAIEFYNALRFLGKNVILASYPGQGHHASKLENKKDFQLRMEQFYDHYLKSKPAPDWMVKGIPYLKKKKNSL
jgi:dipeptidyl aminopeptidase/acylaminoacyl peptidase